MAVSRVDADEQYADIPYMHVPCTMTLSVSSLDGTVVTIEILLTATVLQVKQAIEAKAGHPVAKQRIIFAGRVLDDAYCIADYNIQNNTMLHLVVR